jgi:hypothetical protein
MNHVYLNVYFIEINIFFSRKVKNSDVDLSVFFRIRPDRLASDSHLDLDKAVKLLNFATMPHNFY